MQEKSTKSTNIFTIAGTFIINNLRRNHYLRFSTFPQEAIGPPRFNVKLLQFTIIFLDNTND